MDNRQNSMCVPIFANLEKIKKIKEGGQGKVWLAKNASSGELFAFKEVKSIQLEAVALVFNEIAIMMSAEHQSIVRYYGSNLVWGKEGWNVHFLMELASGDLRGVWQDEITRRSQDKSWNWEDWEEKVGKWLLQILSGICHLHEQNIVHRDLKLDNVLLFEGGEQVKLADFGISRFAANQQEMNTGIGTISYMSPEQIQGVYNSKVDVWQFGGIMYELLSLKHLGAATVGPLGAINLSLPQHQKAFDDMIGRVPERYQSLLRRIFSAEAVRPTPRQVYDEIVTIFGKRLAQFGYCYLNGTGEVAQDKKKAFGFYLAAAGQGDIGAQYNVGYCLQYGLGVEKNEPEAVKWYLKAAAHNFPAAEKHLGLFYLNGQDQKKGIEYLMMAVEHGDKSAVYELGKCYEHGRGVEKNGREAVKFFIKAAEQGFVAAQNYLGYCYHNAQYVTRDDKKSAEWYRKAADQGSVGAFYNVGYLYEHGYGVELNQKEAAQWYLKAAEKGFIPAQRRLAECYQHGKGVEKNEQEAIKWSALAAAIGE